MDLETSRLILRRIDADDFEFFARIHADAEVARYLGHGQPRTREESSKWLKDVLEGVVQALHWLKDVLEDDGERAAALRKLRAITLIVVDCSSHV